MHIHHMYVDIYLYIICAFRIRSAHSARPKELYIYIYIYIYIYEVAAQGMITAIIAQGCGPLQTSKTHRIEKHAVTSCSSTPSITQLISPKMSLESLY